MSDGNASPQDTDGPSSPITNNDSNSRLTSTSRKASLPNDRKRKSGPSTRGVANLTPEQLEKKRKNDREAQRNIRERTKHQIESLERRIRELTSQQPYQEMQNILRQKELVELENAEIKRRLTAVLDIIQPILSGNVLADTHRSSVEAILNHSPVNGYDNHVASVASESAISGLAGTPMASPARWQFADTHGSSTGASPVKKSSSMDLKRDPINNGFLSLYRNSSEDRRELGILPHNRSDLHSQSHHLERHASSPAMHTSLPADHHITLASPVSPSGRTDRDSRQPWECTPQWSTGAGVFDNLIRKFTVDGQQQRAQGVPELDIIGPPYPNFTAITYSGHDIPCGHMSRFIRDILTPFPDVTIIANKMAIAYIMFLIIRWHISPTKQNFERLPPWCRPNSWQLTIPHAIWVDHIPWPDMRTEMVRNPQLYPFDRFFVPHTKTESVNWDHGEAAMYVAAAEGEADGDKVLSQAFETHIRNLENWTLGPAFAKEFPILAATCRITTRGEDERRELLEAQNARAMAR